jgi:hypothetical protein
VQVADMIFKDISCACIVVLVLVSHHAATQDTQTNTGSIATMEGSTTRNYPPPDVTQQQTLNGKQAKAAC